MGNVPTAEFFVYFAVPVFIFITSCNYTRSCRLHGTPTVKKWFSFKRLGAKFIRLYLPYIIFAVCQLILILALNTEYNAGNVAIAFFTGGYGPGNYYLLLMLQIILVFPFLLHFNRKRPNLTLAVCLALYIAYYILMDCAFPGHIGDVTSVGGAINKWTVFRWIFLLDFGIYFYIMRDDIKWWALALLPLADIIPFALQVTTLPNIIYTRGVPWNFTAIAICGLSIKYMSNISFGKLNCVISWCGNATWHVFLFQQLYFWLIGLLGWKLGFTYLSFPICFAGGVIFYTVQYAIAKLIKRRKN